LIALVVVLSLAGCVAIPTSGGVTDGRLIDDQGNAGIVVVPSGPRAGSTQEEVLRDFLQALRGPQGDYATARLFLSSTLSQTWDPDAGALIRTGTDTIATSGENSLSYTFTSGASVNDLGQYFEGIPATQTLDFGLIQQAGEWRINRAPDGIVLSQSSFDVAFQERSLYFFDPSHRFLVPDVRWFPSRPTAAVRVVQALLAGPSDWLAQGAVLTAFPTSTSLVSGGVRVSSGVATVDLSSEALTASPTERDWMRQQLSASLETPNVEMTVGATTMSIDGSGADRAVIDPTVDGPALVGTGSEFGFDAGTGIAPLAGLSAQVVAAGATAADLAFDKRTVAVLGPEGVFAAVLESDAPVLVDDRSGLIAPAIDPFRFVWSARGESAASLATFDIDGSRNDLQSGLPSDNRIVSLDVSRDGARVLLSLVSPVGPRLVVAAVIREDNVPVKLGPLVELAVPSGEPIDATWVDERSVAALVRVAGRSEVTLLGIGGPSAALGTLDDAVAIAGGNGVEGIRIIRSTGELWRPQGSSGWVDTGISASFLATKQ
jgi:hypothetical protein